MILTADFAFLDDSELLRICGVFFPDVYIEFVSDITEFLVAFRAEVMLSDDIAVLRTDREDRRDRDIRQLIILDDFLDELLAGLCVGYSFSHVEMEDGTSGILALQFVLLFQGVEWIVRIADRQLRGVGVVRSVIGSRLDDSWYLFSVFFSKPIRGPFCRGCLQIVEISRLFLILFKNVSHKVQYFCRKFLAFFGSYVILSV